MGVYYPVWGHVITDEIGRFWFLKSNDYLVKFRNCRFVFASMHLKSVDNIYNFFEILSLDKSKYTILNNTIKYSNIIVPNLCFFQGERKGCKCFTSEYRGLISQINMYQMQHFARDLSCEKMYFSYKEYGKQKGSVGEEKIERIFRNQGYKIVYPEKYSVEEQLNMLANCHSFASTDGSSAHNMVFLPKYANVVIIPRGYYLTSCQLALNHVVDLNVTYIDSTLSVLTKSYIPTEGPFYYYVSENLQNFLGINQPCDSRFYRKQLADLKKYMNNIVKYNELDKRYMPEYYCKQFAYCMQQLSNAHPHKKFLWTVLLWGPNKLKRIFAENVWSKLYGGIKSKHK